MKKIIILMCATGFVICSFAQSEKEKIERSKEIILGKKDPPTTDGNKTERSRDIILGEDERRGYEKNGIYIYGNWGNSPDEINAYYHARAKEIKNNRFLSKEQKKTRLKALNKERIARIHQVNGKQNGKKNKDRDKKSKKYKKAKR